MRTGIEPDLRSHPLRIDWIGPIAARLLRGIPTRSPDLAQLEPPCVAFVAAVHERSIYIEHGGSFICIGLQGIGRGPLNGTVEPAAGSGWLDRVRDGEPVRLSRSGISAAAWRVDVSQAREWRPKPWPNVAAPGEIGSAISLVREYQARAMPADGLASLVLAKAMPSAFASLAVPRIEALRRWLEAPGEALPPLDLLGLGPGLTPSGDDCMCGVLLALAALDARPARDRLATAVREAATSATSPLSARFLAAAAEGYGSEALHRFIAALVSADRAALPEAIAVLGRIGHTSGWDALAGAVLAVTACVARQAR